MMDPSRPSILPSLMPVIHLLAYRNVQATPLKLAFFALNSWRVLNMTNQMTRRFAHPPDSRVKNG